MSDHFECLKRVDLIRHGRVYAVQRYCSMIGLAFERKSKIERPPKPEVKEVYDFKKRGAYAESWRVVLDLIREHLECSDIVAIPGHLPESNSLQKLFGEKIRRTREVKPRKYTRAAPWPEDYAQSYEVDVNKITGPRVMLVDDILTTGETIKHFVQVLESHGLEVVPLVLGLDYKLAPQAESAGTLYIYKEREAMDIQIDDLLEGLT